VPDHFSPTIFWETNDMTGHSPQEHSSMPFAVEVQTPVNNGKKIASPNASYVALLLALTFFSSYAYFESGSGWNQDSHFDLTRALVEQHTVRIDSYQANTGDKAFFNGHFYCDKAPGLSLLAAPSWALTRVLARAGGKDPNSYEIIRLGRYLAGMVTVAIPTAVALALFFLEALDLGSSLAGATFAVTALGWSTPLWTYATLFWGHAAAGAFLVLAFLAAKALRKREHADRAPWIAFAVGLAAGWATLIEYPAAVVAVLLAAYAVLNTWRSQPQRAWRAALSLFAGATVCIAILCAYNLAAFHSVFSLSYRYQVDFPETRQGLFGITYPKARVMWDLLLSPHRGILLSAPVLLVWPLGIAILSRNRNTRWHSLMLIAIPLYYFLLNASYVNWDGGYCYGPRYLAPGLFFLAPALAVAWTVGTIWFRALLVLLWGVGAGLSLIAVSTTPMPNAEWMNPFPRLLEAFLSGQIPVYAGTNGGSLLAGLYGIPSLMPLFLIWSIAVYIWMYLLRYRTMLRVVRIAFVGSVLSCGIWMIWQAYAPTTPTVRSLLVRSEYSSHRVAKELERAGVIRSALAFRVWHAMHRRPPLKPGGYVLQSPTTLAEIYDRMARGDFVVYR
jgi:hypothetical protein